MKNYLFLLLISFSIAFSNNSFANSEGEGTIENQFDYLIEKSNRWQDFKVIKIKSMEELKANVADSLKVLRVDLISRNNKISTQQDEINKLMAETEVLKNEIAGLKLEKASIDLFGFLIEKNVYMNIMWGLSGGLLVLLWFFIFRFKRSNFITLQFKQTLAEIQEEYDSYKKRALEREQKLARELQTELNKRL